MSEEVMSADHERDQAAEHLGGCSPEYAVYGARSDENEQKPCYPLFVNLHNQPVVVIGAGEVAERKVLTLVEYGAQVKIVSPEATLALELMAESGIVTWEQRAYQAGDLAGAMLAICACGVRSVDLAVSKEAKEQHIFLNVVDVPELCTFIVPSIVKRHPLQIAISTGGCAPVVAKRMRKAFEQQYPQEFALYIELTGKVRELVKKRVPGPESARKPLLEALADSDLAERILAGEFLSADEVYDTYLAPCINKGTDKHRSDSHSCMCQGAHQSHVDSCATCAPSHNQAADAESTDKGDVTS